MIYAFQAVAPTCMVMLSGVLLRKIGIITPELIRQGNRLCFQVLFPLLIFLNLYNAEEIDLHYIKVILYIVGIILISVMILSLWIPKVVKERRQQSVMIQSIYRGNFMLYALPFSQVLGGPSCVALATSVMAATLPILNPIGVFVFSAFAEENEKPDFRRIILNTFKNPIIWGVMLGLAFYFLPLSLPSFINHAGTDLSKIPTPLAFMLLGAQTELKTAKKNMRLLAGGIFAKLVVMPAVFLSIAVLVFGFRGMELIPIFIFLAAPTAITNYQMAMQYDADTELAGDFLVYSMVASAITIFLFIYILREMQLI